MDGFQLEKDVYSVSIRESRVSYLVGEGFSYVNKNITEENFPIRFENYGTKRVMLLRPGFDEVGTKIVLREGQKIGLQKISYEGALFFAADIFKKFNIFCEIVFLHDPIQINGRGRIIALSNGRAGKEIYLHHFDVEWTKSTVFAFFC